MGRTPHLKMKPPPPLKREALKREAPIKNVILRNSTINNNLKSS